MKLIDKIMARFGYYRPTFPEGDSLTQKEVLEMFKDYGDNRAFRTFIRDRCAEDQRTYFQATNERDRNMIRGAHDRSLYFLALIKKANETRNKRT